VDIFPTIEQLAKFSKTLDKPDGRNLVDLMMNENFLEKPIYIESPPHKFEKSVHVMGIRTSEYKYFRNVNDHKKNIHLYNLKNDPEETTNIALESLTITNDLEQELQNMISSEDEINRDNQSMEPDDLKKVAKELRKMGYL